MSILQNAGVHDLPQSGTFAAPVQQQQAQEGQPSTQQQHLGQQPPAQQPVYQMQPPPQEPAADIPNALLSLLGQLVPQ